MQGKGAIRFFAIALAIACVYSLSFTFVSSGVEKDAKEFANGDPLKERAYLDSMQTEVVYNLGFAKFSYQECKQLQLNLGLDLKGGMNVTMEISLKDLIRSMANYSTDTAFNKALVVAEQRSIKSQKDYISLFYEAYNELKPNVRLAALFATKENSPRITNSSSNEEVLKVLRIESESAIDRSFNILRTRIDKFGVTQPNIQLQQGSNRVLIELPGVTEPERVRKLLQGSAQLEFWDVYANVEIFSSLDKANAALKGKLSVSSKTTDTSAVASTNKTETKKDSSSNDLALLNKVSKDTASKDTAKKDQSFENFAKDNPLFAILTPNLAQDEQGQQVLQQGPVIGLAKQKDTARVNAILAMPEVRANFPTDVRFLWAVKAINENNIFELYAIKTNTRDGKAPLEGDVIVDARADIDQKGLPEVVMVMNAEGSKTWKRMTAEAAADKDNKRSIAIVLDNTVYSAPTVQNEIGGGVSTISGSFTVNETKDLANVLKAGKLPAPAKIVEEAIVGPSLGKEAINNGLMSSILGLIVVLLFMVAYYNNAGFVANLAVFVNVFFLMGVLASLGAVLTLPGIAGIVLTLGMAVDANVLIYERVREELTHGKSLRIAISDGFKHALPSILDSQLTTFLSGVVLALFGSGPILGFATTLIIGILTSLFTSIFITRLIFEWMLNKDKMIKFSNPFSANTFKNANFNFVKNRKVFYLISGTIILAGLISMFTRGFSLGVDFKGGRTYVVRFEKSVLANDAREALDKAFASTTDVKTFGNDNTLKITTSYLIDEKSDETDAKVEAVLKEGLVSLNAGNAEVVSSQKVGPTIANDIKTKSVYAVIFSIIIIALYIFIRFRKWQYSIAALVALTHDVLLVLSFFSLFNGYLPFSLDIDQAFIAAILTVVGYSVTDTVVVFDRIREFLNLHHAKTDKMDEVINDAINSTLSRTIITALTVLFVLLVLFIFGGAVIRGFSFALLVGVIFGTYSSICVASPVIVEFNKKNINKS